MKSSKRILRIRQQFFHLKLLSSIGFIVAGISNFFDSKVATVIEIFAIVLAVTGYTIITHSAKENIDEMAEQNIAKAEALSARIITIIMCLCLVFLSFFTIGSDHLLSFTPAFFSSVLMIFIGIVEFTQAFSFKKLEDA